jgi:hypothetical protein
MFGWNAAKPLIMAPIVSKVSVSFHAFLKMPVHSMSAITTHSTATVKERQVATIPDIPRQRISQAREHQPQFNRTVSICSMTQATEPGMHYQSIPVEALAWMPPHSSWVSEVFLQLPCHSQNE